MLKSLIFRYNNAPDDPAKGFRGGGSVSMAFDNITVGMIGDPSKRRKVRSLDWPYLFSGGSP